MKNFIKTKNIDPRLITILLIVFVQIVGASLILPILPLYAQRQFFMSPEMITLMVSSFFMAQFVAGPFLGRLSDRYGRLPVLIVSQIGTAISFVMLGLAPNVGILFFARVLDGITGGNIIVAQAYITDISSKEKRTQSLGYIFAAFGMGFIIGPALGGVLSAAFGPQIPFFLAALVATATVLLTWFTLDETLSPEQRETNRDFNKASLNPSDVIANFPLVLILSIVFVGQFVMGVVQSTFALYGGAVIFAAYSDQVTNIGVGLLLTTVGLSQFLTQMFLLKRLLKRFGESKLVIIGNLLRALAMIVYAMATSPWIGVVGSILFAVGMGLMMPSLQSLATHTVADELRGGVLGIYQSTMSLATIFGTASGGIMFAMGATTPYWIGGLLGIVSILPAIVLLRQPGLGFQEEPASA
jgi:DHA1 family tetracycline resistance protein-like MFS transporter